MLQYRGHWRASKVAHTLCPDVRSGDGFGVNLLKQGLIEQHQIAAILGLQRLK